MFRFSGAVLSYELPCEVHDVFFLLLARFYELRQAVTNSGVYYTPTEPVSHRFHQDPMSREGKECQADHRIVFSV